MKRLTLNQTWTECLILYEKVCREYKKSPNRKIYDIKRKLIGELGILNDCFFCEYGKQKTGYDYADKICVACPGRIIAKGKIRDEQRNLWCGQHKIAFWRNPFAFFAELKRLNKIRLSRKAKK